MRELTGHKINECNDAITIQVLDEPGQGGACHEYRVFAPHLAVEVELDFQNGPIKEVGTNGITQEVLIAILIDRLEGFQTGPYANDDNRLALGHLREAQAALHRRTRDRVARGVEGTHNA